MTLPDRVILIVDQSTERATRLKDMIEFMDAPEVRITIPDQWRDAVQDRRFAAIFLAETVSHDVAQSIMKEMESIDPNVPIVLMTGDEGLE